MFKVMIVVLVVVIVGIVAFSVVENLSNQITDSTTTSVSAAEGSLNATISGEVTRPGTYILSEEATLADLFSKASGTTSNADPLAYYSDYTVEDGMSFYISPIYDNGDTCSVSPISKVNVNTANKSTLMDVPGIGDAIATSIISYRDGTALFRRLEELKNVSGLGEATFSKCRDYITLKDASEVS